jgi:hypothetical protein
MFTGAEAVEKNHFIASQNRHRVQSMTEAERNRNRFVMLIIAAALAVATLAPVAVLAG